MIIQLNKKERKCREWTKMFIFYPFFFEWQGKIYFVFMQTVEHRQIVNMDGSVFKLYRPCLDRM